MKENIITTIPFGDYNLFKKLCYGSVAEIFLAFKANERGSKKIYLIKRFFNHLSKETNKLQGFIREGEIATLFSHHNIVYCHEFGSVNSDQLPSFYLTMDYVFGQNLAQINRKGKNKALPINITTSIVKSVANGLLYAHSFCDPFTLEKQQITHKDISPDNIIVSYSGETKITDFGISQRGTQNGNRKKISGKFKYMSPEQLLNKNLDKRSDIYSLGVVFWECLTGKRLFPERKELSTGQATVSPKIDHPCTLNSNIPVVVGDICMKCLEPEADDRFQSCQELLDELSKHSGSAEKDTYSLQAYLQKLFVDEYKTEVEELLQAQESNPSQGEKTNTIIARQPTEKTTVYSENKVTTANPLKAQTIYPLHTVDPECVTMTETATDVERVLPVDNELHTEMTVNCDLTYTEDEQTTESELR